MINVDLAGRIIIPQIETLDVSDLKSTISDEAVPLVDKLKALAAAIDDPTFDSQTLIEAFYKFNPHIIDHLIDLSGLSREDFITRFQVEPHMSELRQAIDAFAFQLPSYQIDRLKATITGSLSHEAYTTAYIAFMHVSSMPVSFDISEDEIPHRIYELWQQCDGTFHNLVQQKLKSISERGAAVNPLILKRLKDASIIEFDITGNPYKPKS